MKMAKETWIQGQCQEVEACLRKNNSKKAYQLVKDLTTEKQGKSTTIQDKSGKCLTEENEILNRWTEYLVVLRLNVPVNNFSVMSGRSHRFLGN